MSIKSKALYRKKDQEEIFNAIKRIRKEGDAELHFSISPIIVNTILRSIFAALSLFLYVKYVASGLADIARESQKYSETLENLLATSVIIFFCLLLFNVISLMIKEKYKLKIKKIKMESEGISRLGSYLFYLIKEYEPIDAQEHNRIKRCFKNNDIDLEAVESWMKKEYSDNKLEINSGSKVVKLNKASLDEISEMRVDEKRETS